MEELFKKIRESEKYYITNFAEMESEKFVDYKYFTIEKENIFFYIQRRCYSIGFEVTAYKKIDWNTKQQILYPKTFFNFKELEKIINNTINENKKRILNPLPKTTKQGINYSLKTFYNYNGKYQTLEKHLQDIAGYREKEILKDIDHVEMKLNNKNYQLLEFYNKKGQSFVINTKNIERLIIS